MVQEKERSWAVNRGAEGGVWGDQETVRHTGVSQRMGERKEGFREEAVVGGLRQQRPGRPTT